MAKAKSKKSVAATVPAVVVDGSNLEAATTAAVVPEATATRVEVTPVAAVTTETKETKSPIVEQAAWSMYNARTPYYIRGFLPLSHAAKVAEALGRALNIEDLTVLVKMDGDKEVCAACGTEFQPVSWTRNIDRVAKAIVERGAKSVKEVEDVISRGGSFILGFDQNQRKLVPLAFCGAFFFYKANDRGEYVAPNKGTHLGAAFLANENQEKDGSQRPTRDTDGVRKVLQKWEDDHRKAQVAYREKFQRAQSGVASVFASLNKGNGGNNGKGNPEWHPGRSHQPNSGTNGHMSKYAQKRAAQLTDGPANTPFQALTVPAQ
jgi:hypothetical protein